MRAITSGACTPSTMSARTVTTLAEAGWEPPTYAQVAAVGRATAEAAEQAGWRVDLVPPTTSGAAELVAVFPEGPGRVLAPGSARAAIREVFLRHVIGGKHLSSRTAADGRSFVDLVRGPTPDLVLSGAQLLARGPGDGAPGAGDVVVVDVGGATTDVHSVVEVDPEDAGLSREVVATTPVTRTVEGDPRTGEPPDGTKGDHRNDQEDEG